MRTPLLLLLGIGVTTTVAAASGLPAAASGAPGNLEPVTLKYSWSADRPLFYRLTQQTEADMSGVPGQGDVQVSQSQVMRLRLDPTEVEDDGSATVRTTVEAVRFEMTPPAGEKIEYDSEAPGGGLAPEPGEQQHPAAQAMAAFVGESFTFEIDPTGDVSNVQGMEAILQKVSDQVGDPAMEEMFRGKFGDTSMEAMLEQAFKMLPQEPVEPGATWQTSVSQSVPSLGMLRMENTMTLDRVEPIDGGQVARVPITMTTTLDRAGMDDAELPEGTTIALEESTGRGLLLFDIGRGELRQMEMVSKLPMRMTMTMGEEAMTIKQDITSTVKLERLDNGQAAPATPPVPAPSPAPAPPPTPDQPDSPDEPDSPDDE